MNIIIFRIDTKAEVYKLHLGNYTFLCDIDAPVVM